MGESTDLYEILKNIDQYLRDLSESDWVEALAKEDDRLRLLLARRKTGNLTLPVDSYRPALHSHALMVLQGETEPSTYASQWGEVLKALKPATRLKLASDVFNRLSSITVTNKGAELFVELYQSVAEKMPLAAVPDRALDQLLSKLVHSESNPVRTFLSDKVDDIKKCLQGASDSSKIAFDEAIQSLEEREDENSQQRADDLRRMFGLQRKEQPAEKPEDGAA